MAHALIMFNEDEYFENDAKFIAKVHIVQLPYKLHLRLPWIQAQKPFNVFLHFFNLFITSILLSAFIMLSLVIVAFAEIVGWVTLGVVCFYALVYFCLWWSHH
jgi:hypothetical protein